MFYKRKIVCHFIDRALRFAAGCEIPDKTQPTLLEAYTTTWFQQHGPFKTLYCDGESGLTSDSAKAELRRLGTNLLVRAPGQHARHIESRNAILRHTMHVLETELHRYSLELSFKRLLGEAMLATNAFTFYNGVSPYNALYGRQPPFLPELENIDYPADGVRTYTSSISTRRSTISERHRPIAKGY